MQQFTSATPGETLEVHSGVCQQFCSGDSALEGAFLPSSRCRAWRGSTSPCLDLHHGTIAYHTLPCALDIAVQCTGDSSSTAPPTTQALGEEGVEDGTADGSGGDGASLGSSSTDSDVSSASNPAPVPSSSNFEASGADEEVAFGASYALALLALIALLLWIAVGQNRYKEQCMLVQYNIVKVDVSVAC